MEEQIFEIIRNSISDVINTNFLHLEKMATFYSVYFNTTLFCRINIKTKAQYLDFAQRHKNLFVGFKITQIKSQPDFIRVHFTSLSDIEEMKSAFISIAKALPTPYTFDICHRFEACSDALKCINPDQKHALECSYRKKLENGIVFFGKNRNIE